jgi:hypothetical protein
MMLGRMVAAERAPSTEGFAYCRHSATLIRRCVQTSLSRWRVAEFRGTTPITVSTGIDNPAASTIAVALAPAWTGGDVLVGLLNLPKLFVPDSCR